MRKQTLAEFDAQRFLRKKSQEVLSENRSTISRLVVSHPLGTPIAINALPQLKRIIRVPSEKKPYRVVEEQSVSITVALLKLALNRDVRVTGEYLIVV